MEKHDDVLMHLHCLESGGATGIRLEPLISRNSKVSADRIFFPGLHTDFEGWPIEDLNVLYSAFDLFVSTSRGEGFGLTLLEAASCGIPIVAQNVSAIPEVVGPGGILIEPLLTYTVRGGHDNWLPDVSAFTVAIEYLYDDPDRRDELGRAGAEHAKTFSWDYAARKFDEYVVELANTEPTPATEASEAPNART
jgi:glycosyltransferase involved in cell wall biosynthesis